jgi:hypothetical protein
MMTAVVEARPPVPQLKQKKELNVQAIGKVTKKQPAKKRPRR